MYTKANLNPRITLKNYKQEVEVVGDAFWEILNEFAANVQKGIINPFLRRRGYELRVGNGTWLITRKLKPGESGGFSDGSIAVDEYDPKEFPAHIKEVFDTQVPILNDSLGLFFEDFVEKPTKKKKG